jgi:hypothetical protein
VLRIGSRSNKKIKQIKNKVEIKHKRTKYKRDIDIFGSLDMGYIHGETTRPSFISSNKVKG